MSKAPRLLAPWQRFLQELLSEVFSEDQIVALADDLGLSTITIKRWGGKGIVPQNAERTLQHCINSKFFPEAFRDRFIARVKETYPDFEAKPNPLLDALPTKLIPSELYSQFLRAYAYVAEPLTFYTLINTVTHHLFGHIDSDESAQVSATLLILTPPAGTNQLVRSLYIPAQQISERPSPVDWDFPIFLGTESKLTQITPRYNRPLSLSEQEICTCFPFFSPEVKSLVSVPIQQRGKIAGCLVVSSTRKAFFNQARTLAVYEYALLAMHAFREREFFALSEIGFANFPSFAMQKEQEEQLPFRYRVENVRERDTCVNQEQLEILALQELEGHLIDIRANKQK